MIKPIDGDLQPRLYDRNSVDGRDIDNFEKDKYRAETFRKTLLCFSEQHEESNLFFSAVVYGIYYLNNQNRPAADLTTACNAIREDKFEKLVEIKKDIMLDYTQFGFWKKCLKLNEVLSDHFGLFLRFYERRNKYRYLLRKRVDSKNKMHSEVSTLAISKFDGYEYLRNTLQKQEKKNLQPLDIIYEPTKNISEPIQCYFAPKIYLAFSTYHSRGNRMNRTYTAAKQCPYYQNFFLESEERMGTHVKCCASQAGYSLVFDQSVVNYQENFNKIGDLPFSVYYDFETTTGSAIYTDAKMYVVSYCMIVAFHVELKMPPLVIYRTSDQSLPELRSLDYLNQVKNNFLSYRYHNKKTKQQFENCALSTFNKSKNTVLSELFAVELKLVCDALKNWFSAEVKQVEINEVEKFHFLMKNLPQQCQICDFPIDPFAKNGWLNHVCSAEYLFLENIYSKRDLFKMGIVAFEDFIGKIKKLLACLEEFCESIEFENVKSAIEGTANEEVDHIIVEIKRTRTSTNARTDKQDELTKKQVLGYLYKKNIQFLKNSNINLDMPYSNNFLSNLAGIASNKPVVHHSHVSGKIVGFVHDVCNNKVRENYYTIPIIAHNQFRFDFFFFMQGFRPTVWETTDIKIGAKNVNFATMGNQVRFIDTIKYFQRSLANLADSMNDVEKQNIRDTFARVLQDRLPFCLPDNREWILHYLAKGKGTIPYQKITHLDSLLSRPLPGQEFFDNNDFYSTLREKGIDDQDYEDVKIFFKLLGLRTLGELNRYYNIQDTLILCVIFEQRSNMLQRLFKFNPRKCNSASAFSGYVHRNKSKCKIVLPLDAETVKVFEKITIGGHSGINTRLAFETEVFLRDVENERVLFTDGQQ